MKNALELNAENFKKEVLESKVPVLVDFWAPWCGPCQLMGPILDELAGELEGKVKISKLDVENPSNQNLASQYGIMSIPNMKIFKKGEVIHDIVGLREKSMLKNEIEEIIKK